MTHQPERRIGSGGQTLAPRDPEQSLGGETSSGVAGPSGDRTGRIQAVAARGRPRGTSPLPTPERVARGLRHWFVWFTVAGGDGGRCFRLVMVPHEGVGR